MEMHYPTVSLAEVPRNGPANGADGDRPVVLVFDEDPMIVYTLSMILAQRGFVALSANDRIEALEVAALIPPDVLIGGVRMPELNGLFLAIDIHRAIPDCEIILCLGPSVDVEQVRQAQHGGNDFVMLSKPVDPNDLLACVSRRVAMRDARPQPMTAAD